MPLSNTYPTLTDTLLKSNRIAKKIFLAFVGTGILALSSKIHIPFYPVPASLQTLAVLMIATVYGWKLGGATILLYLLEGMAGLPVFAGKGVGFIVLLGPTGGYLVGYFLAALVCGKLANRGWDRHMGKTFLSMLLGNIVIYIPGLIWLVSVIGWDQPILSLGLVPFILGDLTKIFLATTLLPLVWKKIDLNR